MSTRGLFGKGKRKKPKGYYHTRAKDFGDNPKIRYKYGEASSISKAQWWENVHERTHRKNKKVQKQRSVGKTRRFKSKEAYRKWLAYGHIRTKRGKVAKRKSRTIFAAVPGHQKIYIKGRKHKVVH